MNDAPHQSTCPYPATVRIPDKWNTGDLDNPEITEIDGQKVTVHGYDHVDEVVIIGGEPVEELDVSTFHDRMWVSSTLVDPLLLPDGGRKRERFTVYSDRPFASITYGPSTSESAEYALLVTTREHGQIELLLDKESMYQLWTETHTTPCPEPPIEDDKGQLVQQLLHLADGASEERIETAIRALRGNSHE
ncbi:hypothetical protein K0C01_05300 [Salinarchaeum sp. IM2453]|uniref:hypothetical protein n=1 Tax=Salinarchaeum sp. IM2453 TaxID=2862870 RepID=UPI001C837222|nr:hypothetical protein [Salinarchaeum sp. IM2453]QZA89548.1 hypothetical protein K0C01_05300 [Salinarchaeum sp. IM2453]